MSSSMHPYVTYPVIGVQQTLALTVIDTKTQRMEYLDEIINMRIKPSDKEKLIAKANEDNLSVSAYCRVRLIKELKQK